MVAAHKSGAKVYVPAKTIKFVQKYINDNNLAAHAETKGVTLCKQPYKCPNVAP